MKVSLFKFVEYCLQTKICLVDNKHNNKIFFNFLRKMENQGYSNNPESEDDDDEEEYEENNRSK